MIRFTCTIKNITVFVGIGCNGFNSVQEVKAQV